MNRIFLIVFIASILCWQSKSLAQDSVNDPLEDINIAESLKKSGDLPGQAPTDTQAVAKEEKKEDKKEEAKPETKDEKTADKKAEKDDLEDLDLNEPKSASASEVKMSAQEEADDLQSLKEDIGDVIFAR